MSARVYAIIPAYGRPQLLARACESLRRQGSALARIVVVNNSTDEATSDAIARIGPLAREVRPPCNLGTAGGIAAGLREFLADPGATHAWIVDDDAVAMDEALDGMLVAGEQASAEAVAPLIVDERGVVRWFPGPLPSRAWRCIRRNPRPEDFIAEAGAAPLPWRWAYWTSLVVTRKAVEEMGFPRVDLWSQFSDIEYTLRLSARFRSVLAPTSICAHFPPGEALEPKPGKIFWALQSGCYVCTRLRHGRRALRLLPGLHFRYLRYRRWRAAAWGESIRALWHGAALGETPRDGEFAGQIGQAEAWLAGAVPEVANVRRQGR